MNQYTIIAQVCIFPSEPGSAGPPSNIQLPTITGVFDVNGTLTANNGSWAGSPTSYTYQWKRDGVDIPLATNSTYVVTNTDVDTDISVVVTATNAQGSASATSDQYEILLYVASIEVATPVSVAYGTLFSAITKPATLNGTFNNGAVEPLAMTWLEGTYDPNASGVQTLLANLPVDVNNPFFIQGALDVEVQPQIVVELLEVVGDGTYNWLAGVDEMQVECWAGGGAGSGVGGAAARGWGGGGGGYSLGTVTRPVSGQSAYHVAAAVASPIPSGANVDGTDGQDTTWEDGSVVKAAGGKKGTTTASGLGGAIADGNGTTKYRGGNGSTVQASSRSAAAGGGAGSTGNGGDAPAGSGSTSAPGGAATSENGGSGAAGSSGVGAAGSDYGGGGSGGRTTAATNVRGGSGAKGLIRLTYNAGSELPPAPGVANVYLLTGQSEMIGGSTSTNPSPSLVGPLGAMIYINSSVGFENLDWPNNNGGSVPNGFSSELKFGFDMNALAENEIFLVKKALSGASMFLNFNVANNSIGRTSVQTLIQGLEVLEAQGKTVNFKGVCFMQGLGDMGDNNPEYANGAAAVKAAYKSQFIAWWEYLIDQVEAAGFDTADAKLCVALTDYAYATNPLYQPQIVEAQQEVAALYGGDYTTADVQRGGDGVHPSSTGSEQLGQRFAAYHGPLI